MSETTKYQTDYTTEYQICYRCNLCGKEYWSANETVATIKRKEYKNDAVTTTVWEFHVCDRCLKKLVVVE